MKSIKESIEQQEQNKLYTVRSEEVDRKRGVLGQQGFMYYWG